MIVEERINENLIKHYSSDGKHIRQVETGVVAMSAIDAYPCSYTYEECDGEDISADELMSIILGETE